MNPIHVCAFYKFVLLEDYAELQKPLKQFCVEQGIFGTILLAKEGCNGTVSGSEQAISALKEWIRQDERLRNMDMKDSHALSQPFDRMKVRLKREIVALGEPELNLKGMSGTYVEPENWNRKVLDREIPVIDTRNHYEYVMGSFPGAIDPKTRTFKEFKDYVATLDPQKTPKVAMFCTGGIRCEKASVYMLNQGFEEVYQLKGGILKYLEDVEKDNRWEGECFVFDNRIALKSGLKLGEANYCKYCQSSLKPEDMIKSKNWEYGVSCRHCFNQTTEEKKEQLRCRWQQKKSEQPISNKTVV